MKARQADPDRLLVPMFRAFSSALSFADCRLIVTDKNAEIRCDALTEDLENPTARFTEDVSPSLLSSNGILAIATAIEYGKHAAKRARTRLCRQQVAGAFIPPITGDLPITFKAAGRPYKIVEIGPTKWVCWWHPDERWMTLRIADPEEIENAKYLRLSAQEAAKYDSIHEENGSAGPDTMPRHHDDGPANLNETQLVNNEKALEVECSNCGAEVGRPCRGPNHSKRKTVHPERIAAAHPWRVGLRKNQSETNRSTMVD